MKKILNIALLISISMTIAPFTLSATPSSLQAIVLAAGQGSRLKTGITKMVSPICGQAMVLYTIRLLESMKMPITAVIGFQKEAVQKVLEDAHVMDLAFAEQTMQLGTGHALLASRHTWKADTIIVLNGDMPLIDSHTVNALLAEHEKNNAAITIATSYNIDPANTYGRIVHENSITKIIEKKHFTYQIEQYPQVNVGVYVINRLFLEQYINHIEQNNSTHEFYITDLVEIASRNQLKTITVELPFDHFYGVNTFQELSIVEEKKRNDLIHYWMAQGVRFIAPHTTHLDYNVTIGRGTVIYPGVQLLDRSTVGEFCTIMPHAVITHSHIGSKSTIGAHSVISYDLVAENSIITPLSVLQSSPQPESLPYQEVETTIQP